MAAARGHQFLYRNTLGADAQPHPVMRRRIVFVAALVIVLAFVPPLIHLKRFQAQIAQTISRSVGRKVNFSDVRLRVLPQPGFVFSNFVLAEDPAFGMEPMLSSQEVVARIRLTSLWRGRMEISRLSFDSPSLNFVRNDRGLWNVGGSLRQAATVPAVPTGAVRPSATPRFPYIEASGARVNFKLGTAKQAFSLVDADVSMWLESPNHWEMRLEARPLRTDAYLGDTGILRADASFVRERAELIEEMPLKANIRWDDAQLGQATWLLTGKDGGWRGNLDFRARAEGTSKQLHVTTRSSITGLRRYNISIPDSMNVQADCSADLVRKSTAVDMRFAVEAGDCKVPVGDGNIRLLGRGSWADQDYDVRIVAEKVPLQSFVNFYRRAKLNVSESLVATGILRSDLRFAASIPCIAGTLGLESAHFTDAPRDLDLDLGAFDLQAIHAAPATHGRGSKPQSEVCLTSGPVPVALGGKSPIVLRFEALQAGLRIGLSGQAEGGKALAAVKAFGLLARDYRATGLLTINAALMIDPRDFRSAQWLGSAQSDLLRFPQGIDLEKATLAFNGDQISLQRFSTKLPDLDSEVSGSVTWPLRCDSPPCPLRFALHATSLDLDTINRAVNPNFRKRNWFYLPRFLGGSEAKLSPMSVLFLFKGNGTVQVDRLTLRKLQLDAVNADASWDQDRLVLSNAWARTIGGKVSGNVQIDTRPIAATGKVTLHDADVAAAAPIFGVQWGRGRGTLEGTFSFKGSTPKEIADSLDSRFNFSAVNGSLKGFAEDGDLLFRNWTGQGSISGRRLEITASTLDAGTTQQSVTGNVRSDLGLDLRMQGRTMTTLISGTLVSPQVKTEAATAQNASNGRDATKDRETEQKPQR